MIKSLRKLSTLYTKRDKLIFSGLVVIMIISGLLEAVGVGTIPAFFVVISDPNKILRLPYIGIILKRINIITPKSLLILSSLIITIFFLFRAIFTFANTYIQQRFIKTRQASMTHRLFSAYMKMPYSIYIRRNSAELQRNVLGETQNIANNVINLLILFIQQLLMTIFVFMILIFTNPLIAIGSILYFGIFGAIIVTINSKKSNQLGLQKQEYQYLLIKNTQQAFGAFKECRVLGREKFFINECFNKSWKLAKTQLSQAFIVGITMPTMEFLAISGLMGITISLALTGKSPKEIAPLLALFAIALVRLKAGIGQISNGIVNLRHNIVSVNPIYEDILNLENKYDNNKQISNFKFKKVIKLENITFRYPNSDSAALKNITLNIKKSKSIAFIGTTGSGKTTIVDIILGLLYAEKGHVTVDGKDIHTNITGWQKNIGYVPQFIYLTDDSIKNNVALGIPSENIDDNKIQSSINAAQLDTFIKTLPNGINTMIGEQGVKLSGGQRQRIGIARALYHNPEVLILDEATSSLDNNTERSVISSINKLKGKRTIITIAHRLSTVKDYDMLYLLENGQICEKGKYEELLEKSDKFRKMALQK